MTVHRGYYITIESEFSDLTEDAEVSFYYCKGSPGNWTEPPSDPEIELESCIVDGVDIFDELSSWQIQRIESELMEGLFGEDDFDMPYEDYE